MAATLSLHLHRVTRIDAGTVIERHDPDGEFLYSSRHIEVTLADGTTFELSLFADPQKTDDDPASPLELRV